MSEQFVDCCCGAVDMASGVDPADRMCRIEQFAAHFGRDVLTFGNLLKSVSEAGWSVAEAKFLRKRAVEVAAAAVTGAVPGFGGHIAALDLAVVAAGAEGVRFGGQGRPPRPRPEQACGQVGPSEHSA